jgi:hypothetical protein
MRMTTKTISHKEARGRIASLLDGAGHVEEAKRMATGDYADVEFTSGVWADEAHVYVKEDCAGTIGGGAECRLVATYHVQLNWSATYRSPASATVAVANYCKAINLAAKIEALVEGFPTVIYEEK